MTPLDVKVKLQDLMQELDEAFEHAGDREQEILDDTSFRLNKAIEALDIYLVKENENELAILRSEEHTI